LKNLAKFFCTHLSQPIERRINQFWAGLKLGRIRYRRFAIPWADVLADIAAEDMPSHSVAHLFGNRAALFDREIGDTLVGVELVRCNQRVGWAGIDASCASTAAIGRGNIGLEFEGRQDNAQEQPRTQFLVEDAGVLADPADAGVFGVHALDERTSIHVATGLKMVSVRWPAVSGRVVGTWNAVRTASQGLFKPRFNYA